MAGEKFRFSTRLHLSESLGLKALTLEQMLEHLKHVPGSSIYHHTHRVLQQHEHLSPEPPNDFAYWISGVLGEDELGEQLASLDIVQFKSIRELRERMISLIEYYLEKNPQSKLRFARPGREFFFLKSISFIIPTKYEASSLREFMEALKEIDVNSLYYHVFEARLRLEDGSNDFSNWIKFQAGDEQLAAQINSLDPYTYALDDLRNTLIKMIRKRIG